MQLYKNVMTAVHDIQVLHCTGNNEWCWLSEGGEIPWLGSSIEVGYKKKQADVSWHDGFIWGQYRWYIDDSTDESGDDGDDDSTDESGEGGDDESIESVPESQ